MARDGKDGESRMTSRWWPVVCLAGIAGWAAVTLAGAYVWPGGEAGGRYAFVIYGSLGFAGLFGYSAWTVRRMQRRGLDSLYERLALTPVSAETLRTSTRGLYRIGYTYFAAGAAVTALGFAAIVASGTPWEGRLLRIVMAIVVLWFFYMLYALRQIGRLSAGALEPLGLALVSLPSLSLSPFHDIRTMEGAVGYAGRRHDRDVSIAVVADRALTVVSGPAQIAKPPKTPVQMASLTREPISCWRHVHASITDEGDVLVERTGHGCGRWFLHDILLAESVAGASERTRGT